MKYILILILLLLAGLHTIHANEETKSKIKSHTYACDGIKEMLYYQRQDLYSSIFESCIKQLISVKDCQSIIQNEVMPDVVAHHNYQLEYLACELIK